MIMRTSHLCINTPQGRLSRLSRCGIVNMESKRGITETWRLKMFFMHYILENKLVNKKIRQNNLTLWFGIKLERYVATWCFLVLGESSSDIFGNLSSPSLRSGHSEWLKWASTSLSANVKMRRLKIRKKILGMRKESRRMINGWWWLDDDWMIDWVTADRLPSDCREMTFIIDYYKWWRWWLRWWWWWWWRWIWEDNDEM